MPVKLREKPRTRAAVCAPGWLMAVLLRAGAALLGFLGARAPLLAGERPLGLCFAVSVPAPCALFAAAGAALGYLLPSGAQTGAAYLAAVAACALLRGFARLRRAEETPMAPPAVSCVVFCLVRCGLAAAAHGGLAPVFTAAAITMLTLGFSYLLTGFFTLPRPYEPRDAEERAAQCFACMALLACLTPYHLFTLSLAHIAAACAVLTAAARGRAGDAATLGVAFTLTLCAVRQGDAFAGLGIAAGGLAAALFSSRGRPVAAFAFCCAGLSGVLCAPDAGAAVRLGVELCCAGGIFCLVPARVVLRLAPQAAVPAPAGTRAAVNALSERLENVSRALSTVGDTMRAVCRRMPPRGESVGALCDDVAARCCAGCEKRITCWVDEANTMYDAFNALAPRAAREEMLTAETLPPLLANRCCAPQRLANAINTAAAAQRARRAARAETDAARAALCEQYAAMACALTGLAGQAGEMELPDPRKARRLERLFREIALDPVETSVSFDAAGRLTATVCIRRTALTDEEQQTLTDETEALLRRPLAPVCCRDTGALTKLVFREAPRCAVECGVSALPARGGVCADAVRTFTDAQGRFVAVLSDGMGTGKRAAVGGVLSVSLARELLRAGVESESAAALVNIALSVKGDEENAVTLDVLTLDLYTGEAWVYKAGAAASFVLHEGTCTVYSSDTLPIGILEKVTGRRERIAVAPGDTVVLVSDGALAPGADWLRATLLAHANDAPRALADAVAHAAMEKQKDSPDDVTVLAVRLFQSVFSVRGDRFFQA